MDNPTALFPQSLLHTIAERLGERIDEMPCAPAHLLELFFLRLLHNATCVKADVAKQDEALALLEYYLDVDRCGASGVTVRLDRCNGCQAEFGYVSDAALKLYKERRCCPECFRERAKETLKEYWEHVEQYRAVTIASVPAALKALFETITMLPEADPHRRSARPTTKRSARATTKKKKGAPKAK